MAKYGKEGDRPFKKKVRDARCVEFWRTPGWPLVAVVPT